MERKGNCLKGAASLLQHIFYRLSLEETNGRSCYSEGPTGSDSLSFDSSILSNNEQFNLFYSGEPDISDVESDRSATVTPLPDMEFVTTEIKSKPKRRHKSINNNPFLDDVSNPFDDDKIEDEKESPTKDKSRGSIDTQSSASTVFEQNNPFFVPRENSPQPNSIIEEKIEFDHTINKDKIIESKTDNLHSLDSFDGLDEVVKELELLALVEKELNEEEMKEKCMTKKQKPSPPKRHSSLFHNSEDSSILKDISNKIIDFSDVEDSVPLCLSVETKRKEIDMGNLTEWAAKYESNDEDTETSDRKEQETDEDNDCKQLLAPAVNINNTEDMMLKAPDVVITNREELNEDHKENEKVENKTIPGLPDMLTHVSESNVLNKSESLDTSDPMAAPDTLARSAEQRLSESVTESASHPGMTNNAQYRQEAPRLRITEPFTREAWVEEPIKERHFHSETVAELERNHWELPETDLSQERMEQRSMVENQAQANTGNRQTGLQEYKDIPGEKKQKKKGFFRNLKKTFGFSSKSKKSTADENKTMEYKDFDISLANQFLPDSPRMTSTPLSRSASARDSRGVSCSIDRHGQDSLIRLPDCTKFGGDLPPAYRTAALKNQHQRWSFAAISQTMYHPNPNTVQEQLLPYSTAMQADMYYTLPTQHQYPPPYHPPYPSYPITTVEPTPMSRPRSYSNQPYPVYGINRVEEDRHSLALYPHFSPPITSMGEGIAIYSFLNTKHETIITLGDYIPAPSPSTYYDYIPEPGLPRCDCPMCYHSVKNTCSVCGCPNSTSNNNTHSASTQHSISTQYNTSTSTSTLYNTSTSNSHNNTARLTSPYRTVVTAPSPDKPQVVPSRSIHQLYSQRKSSSPVDINNTETYAGTERSNLYKPTSLQDFKKLISLPPDQNDVPDAKLSESEGVMSSIKTSGSLKKPSLWMDNRFSIIQEEPDIQMQDRRRSQEEDLAKMGFLV